MLYVLIYFLTSPVHDKGQPPHASKGFNKDKNLLLHNQPCSQAGRRISINTLLELLLFGFRPSLPTHSNNNSSSILDEVMRTSTLDPYLLATTSQWLSFLFLAKSLPCKRVNVANFTRLIVSTAIDTHPRTPYA